MKRGIILILILCGWLGEVKAQQVEYIAELDTNYILIGDQIHLRLKVKAEQGIKVVFPSLQDTVTKGVEIISGPVRDSIREKDGRMLFRESYVVTAFDSGYYVIPEIPIKIEREDYTQTLRTDPLALIVNTYEVDKEKYFDIVMPQGAPWTLGELLPYLLWIWGGVVVVVLVGLLIIRLRSKGTLFGGEKEVIPPYVLAIQALDGIREEKLWQQGRPKEYYTRLTDVLRGYMEGELNVSAMEQTSNEILTSLEEVAEVSPGERKKLGELLEMADLVKFAKATPLLDEDRRNLDVAYEFVQHTNEQVEKERAREVAEESGQLRENETENPATEQGEEAEQEVTHHS